MTTVNQPLPIEADATEFDPFAAATEAQARTFDLFGMVEISAWACHLEKGQGKIPFDPQNPNHKRMTAIDVFIQPLAEIDIKYPKTRECHWLAEYNTWAKITLPSIKDAYQRATGQELGSVKQINGMYARVARVDSFDKKYKKKDNNGNLTGEMVTPKTFRFVELYADENQCRAAYTAAGGQPMQGGSSAVAPSQEQSDKSAAMAFLPVIVKTALNGKGLKINDDWKTAVTTALTQFPMVAKHFTADAPEVANYALPLLEA
jgi:hypothetical protein